MEELFKKYDSIENHYREKHIERFISRYGSELLDAEYVIQEKIHGANFQVILTPDNLDKPIICSRNRILSDNENFYNAQKLVADIDFSWAAKIFETGHINLYGELFGPGIQKGVEYGEEKQILWFDMRLNNKFLTQSQLHTCFADLGLSHFLVPSYAIIQGLREALEFDARRTTMLGPQNEDNLCEGVVIKPYRKVFFDQNEIFYIKKKNDEFKDKSRTPKRKIDQRAEFSEEVNLLRENFLSYVNENTVQSVFSKEGVIDDHKDIGKYIGLVMQDAYGTFLRENPGFDPDSYETRELKYIRGNTKELPKLLMKEL